MQYLFLSLSSLTIIGALLVIFSKKPLYSILYLIITFFTIASHFALLNAQFLAVVQIILYAGAIMVLFLFVVMLLNLNVDSEPKKSVFLKFIAAVSGGMLLLLFVIAFKSMQQDIAAKSVNDQLINASIQSGMVATLGKALFLEYVLPFELVSILFLTAIVGAVLLGKKDI